MPEVRDFEPVLALDGGRDGLDFYRRALLQVSEFLAPGGWFLGEIGAGQDQGILEIAEQNPVLGDFAFVPDLAGIKRVFKARKRTGVIGTQMDADLQDRTTPSSEELSPKRCLAAALGDHRTLIRRLRSGQSSYLWLFILFCVNLRISAS